MKILNWGFKASLHFFCLVYDAEWTGEVPARFHRSYHVGSNPTSAIGLRLT